MKFSRLMFCRRCGYERYFSKLRFNHFYHLAATVFTFGLWGVGWIVLTFRARRQPWRCCVCHSRFESGSTASRRWRFKKVLPPGTFHYVPESGARVFPQENPVVGKMPKGSTHHRTRHSGEKIHAAARKTTPETFDAQLIKKYQKVQQLEVALAAQAATVAAQQAEIQALAAKLKEQTALLEKLSEERTAPTPRFLIR